jgi:hypothetical protein
MFSNFPASLEWDRRLRVSAADQGGVVHEVLSSRMLGPHSWFRARAVFARDLLGNDERIEYGRFLPGIAAGPTMPLFEERE